MAIWPAAEFIQQPRLTQYHRLVDELTGDERIVRGPQAYAPEPLESIVPWQRLHVCRRVAHHIQIYIQARSS
jgi:hypothetical protein